MESAPSSSGFTKLNHPAHQYLCSTLQVPPHDDACKTRGQDGFATSFPVGLLHPLQHAGLSRRTPVCPASARNGRKVQFRAGSSGFVKHSLDTPHHGECVAHISSTGSLMGSLLNHPAALSAQGLVQSSAAKANCIQPGPGGRFLQSPSLVTTSTAGLLCFLRISPSRNRSVRSARRWMEAFRLSINWELIAG